MKTRFPLYAKILLYFLLNLAVVGALFLAFFQAQFHAGLDSLLLAQAGERVQAIAQIMAEDLSEGGTNNWNRVLQRFGDAYGIQFFLFQSDGRQAAGNPVELPAEVKAKLTSVNTANFSRRGPPPGRGPNRFNITTNNWSPPGRGLNRQAAHGLSEPLAKFLVQTRDAQGCWIGVCLADKAQPALRGMEPLILVGQADSLFGGLFPSLAAWLYVGLGAVVCSALLWLPFARGITRSIRQMTQATERIAESHFDTRVNAHRSDELGRLGRAINRMSERLQGYAFGQRRFLGDVAHELCSPLARMEVATSTLETQATPAQKECLESIQEDLRQMSELINELLSFSKASLQAHSLALAPLTLATVIQEALEHEQANADQFAINVNPSFQVLGERRLLVRALANILRNALRYGGSESPIEISATVQPDAGTLILSIADHGPGVPPRNLEQIFDPFFRVEPSRSRETGGTGLGLAIVKSCLEACQGSVSATNRQPQGLQINATLKLAPVQNQGTQ